MAFWGANEGKTFFDDTLAGDLAWQDYFPPSAGGNANATGANLTVTLSIAVGAATGAGNATGAALSVTRSVSGGAAIGGANATGTAQVVSLALVAGSASSVGDGSAPGATLAVVYTIRGGKARGPIPPGAFGKTSRNWQPFAQSFAA